MFLPLLNMHVESMVEQYYLSVTVVGGGAGPHKYVARVRVAVDETSHKQLMTKH